MAIKLKSVVTMKSSAICPSHSRSDVSTRDVALHVDEPIARGGTNAGPSPTETALGALIGCTNVIGHKCADALGIDIGHLKIDAAMDFDRRGVTFEEEIETPFVRVELTVTADGPATDAELQKVASDVAKYCPLAKLFRNAGTEVIDVWKKA